MGWLYFHSSLGSHNQSRYPRSIIWLTLLASLRSVEAQSQLGNNACRCLSREELDAQGLTVVRDFDTTVGQHKDEETYGIGCAPHDEDALSCSDANDCSSIVPLPADCDKSYCARPWCYVSDSDEACSLMRKPSELFRGRYYSYATCGELDRFTYTERLKSLKGQTFKVGFTSNSGGWKGGFNPEGSFASNELWNGPIVDFVREAALVGGFQINMTQPPSWLRSKSEEFFGGSSFDYCVYATSLGYLDFCVSGFTITEKRSSVTTMFEATNDPFYLIVFANGSGKTSWETFVTSTFTIFQPFTAGAWAMIFIFALPTLGLLMFFHEYGSPGSSYPKTEPVLMDKGDGEMTVHTRQIPMTKHLSNSLYTGMLSFFQGSYDLSVVTLGGKINLLAISSFVMLVLAVYTANLAAILTQNALQTSVDSIEMAIQQDYNFCAERKLANSIMEAYGVDSDRFVPDPVSLGGDGQAGFNCQDCSSRERIFEFMRQSHNDGSLYCNAAIAKIEDLQIMQRHGKHCDKTKVGDSLGQRMIGIPIYDEHAPALSLLFHKLKTDGVMAKALHAAEPSSQCPVTEGEGSALNIQQMTGVWVITLGFAFIGLMVRFLSKGVKARRLQEMGYRHPMERKLRRFDQWLNPPSYDVIVDGYRYDSENNAVQRLAVEDTEHDLQLQHNEDTGEESGDSTAGGTRQIVVTSLAFGKGSFEEASTV